MIRALLTAIIIVFLVTLNFSPSCAADQSTGLPVSGIASSEAPMVQGTVNLSLQIQQDAEIDDVAVADILSYSGSKPTITAPEGWHLIRDDSTSTTRQSLYWHAIEADDSKTASWTFSEPVNAQGAILLLNHAFSDSPVDSSSGNTGDLGLLVATPVVAGGNGELVLAFYATDFGGIGLSPSMPDDLDMIINHEATNNEYWILANYPNQSGSTEEALCPTPQLFNWVAAQVAIRQSAP